MKLVRVGINTTPSKLTMEGNGAQNKLQMHTEKPKLNMESKRPVLHIDQSDCWAEVGLKNVSAFREDSISYSQSVYAKGVARIIDQGNRDMEIQNGSDSIAEQADYNAFAQFEQEFTTGFVPTSRPKISVEPGSLNYSFQKGSVHNNTSDEKVRISYQKGSIEYHTY